MTSHSSSPVPHAPSVDQPREPLRLRLSTSPGQATLDGGWWPQSREIGVEVADLVDHFPTALGRVLRAVYSRPDWDAQPHSVPVGRGRLKIGSFPGDDTHMIVLRLWSRTDLRLLVVPPDHPKGEQAMTVAADPSNLWSTAQILTAAELVDGESSFQMTFASGDRAAVRGGPT